MAAPDPRRSNWICAGELEIRRRFGEPSEWIYNDEANAVYTLDYTLEYSVGSVTFRFSGAPAYCSGIEIGF